MSHLKNAFEIIWRLISAPGALSDRSFDAHHSRKKHQSWRERSFNKIIYEAEHLRQCIIASTLNFNLGLGIKAFK
jgi:hypothetical protein